MRLFKFIASFDLDIVLSKADFPFLFNTKANFDYVGPMPAVQYYSLERMSSQEKQTFLDWHAEQVANGYIFSTRDELIKYCKNDVMLLQAGCIRFMVDFIALSGVSPFLEGFTSAQVVLFVYRRNFMPANSLGVTLKNNYCNTNQSNVARKWLTYKKMQLTPDQCMETEVKLSGAGNLIFDAVVRDLRTNRITILEFFGCFYHMHSPCPLLKWSDCNSHRK